MEILDRINHTRTIEVAFTREDLEHMILCKLGVNRPRSDMTFIMSFATDARLNTPTGAMKVIICMEAT